MELDIRGLDKAEVLCALYARAKAQGLGLLHYTSGPLPYKQACKLLQETMRFDYLHGRVLKVNLAGDILQTALYDRDNGPGAAREALLPLI